ncbi:Oxysterol-binding protein [Chytridium lagenaria]|nr:Oxysterol-binding protein [Chytridium lagenaria]
MTEPTAPVRTQSLLPQKKDPFGSVSIVASSSSILPDLSTLLNSHRGHLTESSTRSQLPLDPYKPKPAFQAWSFIKSAIGKDLSKVTLPVFFNEPLSLLQRLSEDIEFAELLALASHIGRPRDPDRKGSNPTQMGRLLYVAAYAMSNYSSTVGRTTKPFNPLLGETFEYVNDEKEYRYISEQVCHHPPISACYVDSPDWAFWTEVNLKSKFWGSSLELHPLGNCHARLPLPVDVRGESGATEHYAWKKVTTTVNNLIVGKLSITHLGDMVIRNLRTGDECILTFRPKQSGGNGSWFGWGGSEGSGPTPAPTNDLFVNVGEIVGVYKDRRGNVRWNLVGSWGDKLTATRVGPPPGPSHQCLPSTLTLWARRAAHPLSQHLFNQTPFAMKLNELTEELKSFLPPTDSRLRLDQRAMEEGKWDDANKSKEQLEIVQRVRRRAIVSEYEATGRPSGPLDPPDAWWNPRWFVRTIDPETGEPHWAFTHEYWQWREKGVWPEWVLPVLKLSKLLE